MMQIGAPFLYEEGSKLTWQAKVSMERTRPLWYRVDEKYSDFVSKRSDAALVALLIPAMDAGQDIHVDGTISERLYYTLSRPYQAVLQAVHPSLETIDIYPEDVKPATDSASGVATGFSAGIDSFSVLADHHYTTDVPTGFRVTHLLFNNVGSHGSAGERLFWKRYKHVDPSAERIGLPLIAVNSNLDTFYSGWSFQETHTPRNVSVALMLQRRVGRFLYGSGRAYPDTFVGETNAIAYTDPVALPLLSTDHLDVVSTGSEYTRPEKTVQVADIEDSHQALNVCIRPDAAENCSACSKCLRTLLTLEIAGLLSRYEAVFDLEAYQAERDQYMGVVLRGGSSFARKIVSFAKSKNFKFPASARKHQFQDKAFRFLKWLLQTGKRYYLSLREKCSI